MIQVVLQRASAMLLCLTAGVCITQVKAEASSLTASYFSLASGDSDVGNNQGAGAMVSTVGAGLGPSLMPVVDTSSAAGALLHDVNASTHELQWWSPGVNPNVSVLANPIYPTLVDVPLSNDHLYTNSTVLGANGDDSAALLTAEGFGQFLLPAVGNIDFTVCSDDDTFVYIAGGAFGGGTLVADNGGIHGPVCTSGNVNAGMLTNAAAGTYTLYLFYADRARSGASISFDSPLALTHLTPEPGSWTLFAVGAGLMGLANRRRQRR